jgi:tape measure domain-containing protein
LASLGDLFVTVGAKIDGFESAMGDVSKRIGSIDREASRAFGGFDKIGDRLIAIGTPLLGISATIIGVGAASTLMAEKLNMANIAFETMLGSAQAAGTFLSQLKEFAVQTPFEFPDLVEASKRMLAMGFAADQVLPSLRTIGDSVAALGGGKDVINGVTLALGQMQAKGKVSAQEMNQLAERGIPAWRFLADQIGVSIPEAMKLAENGAIQASVAIPAILEGMNQKFGGSMEKIAKTLTGTWSNFRDQLSLTLAEIGSTLTPTLLSLVQAALPFLDVLRESAEWFAALPEPTRNVAIAIAAITAAVGPVTIGLGLFITQGAAVAGALTSLSGVALSFASSSLPAVTSALSGVSGAFAVVKTAISAFSISAVTAQFSAMVAAISGAGGITAAVSLAGSSIAAFGASLGAVLISPIGIAVASVAALGAVAYLIYDNWADVKNTLSALWADISNIASVVWNGMSAFFGAIWDGVAAAFKFSWDGIAAALGAVWDAISGKVDVVWVPIAAFFGVVWDGVAASFVSVWNGISSFLLGIWTVIADTAKGIWEWIVNKINWALDQLAKILPNTAKALKDWGDGAGNANEKIKDLAAETKAVTDTQKALKPAIASATVALGNQKTASKKLSDEHKSAKDSLKKFNDEILIAKYQQWQTEQRALVSSLASLQLQIESGTAGTLDFNRELAALDEVTQAVAASLGSVSSVDIPDYLKAINTGVVATNELGEAFKTLGVTTSTSLQEKASAAQAAYETIRDSGVTTADEVLQAERAALSASIEARRSAGEAVAAEDQARLDQLNAALGASVKEQKTLFSGLKNQVSTIMTDLSKGITDIIFEGKGFGETFKGIFEELGKSVTRFVIEFLEGKLVKALTGLLDGPLAAVGNAIGGIFGGGASVASTAGINIAGLGGDLSAPLGNLAGTGTGATGAVSGAASGVLGTIGAIGSIGSLVTGVIGLFQNSGMNENLQLIENNTRRLEINFANLLEKALIYWPGIKDIHEFLWGPGFTAWSQTLTKVEDLYGAVEFGANNFLREIKDGVVALPQGIGRELTNIARPSVTAHITVHSSDPNAAANEVMRQLRAQGAFA